MENPARLEQEEKAEEKRLAIMMMKKKEKYLYDKIMFGKKRKVREVCSVLAWIEYGLKCRQHCETTRTDNILTFLTLYPLFSVSGILSRTENVKQCSCCR